MGTYLRVLSESYPMNTNMTVINQFMPETTLNIIIYFAYYLIIFLRLFII